MKKIQLSSIGNYSCSLIYDLIEKYRAEKEVIIFKTRQETDEYLKRLG